MPTHRPDLHPLPDAYRALLGRALGVFEADPRVIAAWLSGSLARGTADAFSDLDLLVATSDDGHPSFTAEWTGWLEAITPTVLAKRIPGITGLFAVTPEWLRLDVAWEARGALPDTFFRERALLFDRDACAAALPAPFPRAGASTAAVLGLVEESLRILGLLPVAIGREDWLLGVEGVHTQRLLLYQLLQQINAPLPVTGLKQWSSKLNAEQRRRFEALPTGAPDPESIVAGTIGVVEEILREARAFSQRMPFAWPESLEAATRAHLQHTLGVSFGP
jgi:hypothetical protein